MTVLALPALRSDDTLGFLAALGLLELSTSALGFDARLGWEGVGGAALLDCPFASTDVLVAELGSVVTRMVGGGQVLPCVDPGPVRPADRATRAAEAVKGKLDPAHLKAGRAIDEFSRLREAEAAGDRDSARWLAAVVNQLTNAASTGHRALTLLYSPSGQMTLHQLYRDHLEQVQRRPTLLAEALEHWVRTPGQTGANLDGRSLRDATVDSSGKSTNAAVVGATWLALMAVPFFPQVSGRRPRAVGWSVPNKGQPALRWPIWTRLLDRPAVEVILGHPALDEEQDGRRVDARLRALGVIAVCRSSRKGLSQSGGALRAPTVVPVQ